MSEQDSPATKLYGEIEDVVNRLDNALVKEELSDGKLMALATKAIEDLLAAVSDFRFEKGLSRFRSARACGRLRGLQSRRGGKK